jgi:hypothetical protein
VDGSGYALPDETNIASVLGSVKHKPLARRPSALLYAIYSFTIWDVFSVYAAAPIGKPIREMQITATDDV